MKLKLTTQALRVVLVYVVWSCDVIVVLIVGVSGSPLSIKIC